MSRKRTHQRVQGSKLSAGDKEVRNPLNSCIRMKCCVYRNNLCRSIVLLSESWLIGTTLFVVTSKNTVLLHGDSEFATWHGLFGY